MNRRLTKAMLFLAMLQPQIGAGEETRCEVLGRNESSQAHESIFNPDGRLELSTDLAEAGGLCDGAIAGWSWQMRAAWARERFVSDKISSDVDTTLRQFYRTFELGNRWSFTVGRKLRGWDVAYVAQPIDFLGDPKTVRDLEDRLSQRRASAFLGLDRIGDAWTTSFIIGENRLYSDVRSQAIVLVERDFQGTQVQWIAQKPSDQPWGAGGGTSTVVGTALELHGSFFARRGTDRPIHLSLLNDDVRFYQADEKPVANHRRHDGRWYPRWVLGGQWTAESGVNVLLEWSHDERGLSPVQWRQLIALARFHASGGDPGVSPVAIARNLALDAASLSSASGTMQDYAFVRFVYPFQQVELEFSSLINAHDRSTSSGIRFTYKPAQRVQTWVDLRWNRGRDESEFGEVPVARDALLALRYFF